MRNPSISGAVVAAVLATATYVVGAPAGAGHAAAPAATADPAGELRRAVIVSRAAAGAFADQPSAARQGETVTLFALAELRRGDQTLWLGDPDAVTLAGHRIALRPWRDGPAVHVAWNRVEPATANMSNT